MRQEVLIQFQWDFPGLIYLFSMDGGGEFGGTFTEQKLTPLPPREALVAPGPWQFLAYNGGKKLRSTPILEHFRFTSCGIL